MDFLLVQFDFTMSHQNKFETLEDLELGLAEYVYWYNNLRIHGSLDYMTPVEYKKIFSRKARKVA